MNNDANDTPIYLDPTKRHEFVLLFEVKDGNPNGNPDAGNLPRIDPETGHGIVTDVSVKRKVRDYVQRELKIQIFIQSEFALNSLIFGTAKEIEGIPVPRADIKDPELLRWLRNNVGKIEGLEDLGLEGNEVFFGGEFNKKVFRKTLMDHYKQETDGLEEKLKHAAKALKDFGRYDSEDEALLEALDGHEDLNIEANYIVFNDGVDRNSFEEGNLTEIPKNMLSKIQSLVNDLGKNAKKKLEKEDREKVRQRMIDKYFDIKMFGAVLSTGINAGQVRGPMQIKFGRSIDQVVPLDHSITRCAITRSEDFLRKETEMARKSNIPYGLYRVHGYYNPSLALRKKAVDGEKDKYEWETYVTKDDMKVFWEALEYMYEKHSASSAAAGEQATRGLWIFSHDTAKGNAHAHKLFELIKVTPCGEGNEPREFETYEKHMEFPGKENGSIVKEALSLEKNGFPGVTITRLV
jgi:CRISPR-associated protein Csd2